MLISSNQSENGIGAFASKLSALPTQLQELISANVLPVFAVMVNVISSSALAIASLVGSSDALLRWGVFLRYYSPVMFEIDSKQVLRGKISERFSESAGLATEAVTSIRTIASLTPEPPILEEYRNILGGMALKSMRSTLWTTIWFDLSQAFELLVMALGFWYGTQLIARGEYTVSQSYVILIAVVFGGQAAVPSFGYSISIMKAVGAANYILCLRTLKPKIVESDDNKDVGPP